MHRFRAVVLGVRKRTIWPNLGRRAGATALLVLLAAAVMLMAALPGGPFVSRAASAPIASSTLLAPDALDGRLADDGVTPIAVRGDGEVDGSPVVYGARPYEPIVLDVNATIPGTRYFVDCGQPTDGDGTQASPFNALDSVNALTLSPGDQVLLKTGVACTGMLQPQGSGTADAPIHLDSYGPSDVGMARIDANGKRQAILLQNVEHYVVRNLELTNRTGDARDMNENRHGLDVELLDFGQATGFEVTGLYIHDVLGAAEVEWTPDEDNCLASGGICFDVLDSEARSTYSDVEISFNTIRHVNRIGIALRSGTNERPEARNDGFANWSPWDPFSIHDNFLTDIGGDGMIVSMASGSTVDHNTVERSGSELGEDRLNGPTAALWAWDADRVTFAYNHVFGTERHLDNGDGTAFDADHSSTEMVFEHNLSHDNQGGFLMFCGCYGLSTKTAVRYNISLNDGLAVPLDPELGDQTARTFKLAGQTDGEVYNNTVLLPATDIDIAHQGDPSNSPIKNSVVFLNNVWLAQEGTQVHETASTWAGNVVPWRNNVFGGTATGWPQGPLANIVNPDLAPVAGSGLAALQLQSEEILARGAPVAPEGVTDVRGVPVPWVTPPDNGAWQYTATDPASQVTVQNGGFSAGVTGWTLDGAAVAATPTEEPGLQVTFPEAAGSATQTVNLAVNRSYELLARVHGTDAGNAAVSVLLPSGATVIAEPAGAADAEGYVPHRAVFRTAEDASTAVLTVSGSGGAAADDIQLVPVDDRMVDGSFEALENTVWQLNLHGEMSDPPLRSADATSGFHSAELTASQPSVNPVTYVEPEADYTLTVFAKAQPGKTVRLNWSGMAPGESGTIQTSSTQWVQLTLPLRSTATPETSSPVTVSCEGAGLCDDMTLVRAFDGAVPRVDADTVIPGPSAEDIAESDHLLTGHAVAVTSPPLQFSAGDTAADPVTLVGAQVTRVGDDTDPAALAAAGSATIDAAAKTVTFVPDAGMVGPLVITYTVADALGRTATAVIPVVVLAQPVANADTLQVAAGGSGEVNVLANDVLDTAAGGVYLVSVATSGSGAPTHGTVSVDAATGTVAYTAGDGVAGVQDTFSYTVTDQFGVAGSSTVTVTIAAAEAAGEVTTFVQKIARDVSNQWVPMGGSAWTALSDQGGMPGSNANGVTVVSVSGLTGLFRVDHLQANTAYWLMEAQAPKGFALLAEPIRFSVDDAGAVTLLASAGGSSGGADTVVSQSPADPSSTQAPWSIITVRDVPTVQLPMTGGNLLAPLSAIGWLLLAVGALGGMLLWRRRSTPSR